ncbi:hypothetical protein CVT26_003039 [Gymnopilus dilepis]|uniref:Uncharacterized protein n=1 Tax=Gymnopilus dilepis TaxID=231916 RepID=A0A409Y4T2_9AGAR|nr:hypothetical protein CVT26_003039 [Gymnopilus dilepis]
MAKQTQVKASKDRPAKKARLESSNAPKAAIKRKGSPHPASAKSSADKTTVVPTPAKGKENAKDREETTPVPKSNSKNKGKAKATEDPAPLPASFKIVAGSYEKLLYGLDGTISFDEDTQKLQYTLKPVFIFPAHVSCIKAVAASPHGGKWLATGSADEIIKVWDLRRRKEIGGLMHHEGSITHLLFPSRSHLLSASEDGTLCLFRARDWAVLRALKGHKGRVNAVAVHPSGKVALSVGKDKALRMWDLMRGKGVASTKLGKEGEIVRWSVDGSKFLVQSGSSMDVYATNMDHLFTITHPSRIHDAKFCPRVDGEGELLLVAAEDKKLSVYDVPAEGAPKLVAVMVGHQNRSVLIHIISLPPSSNRTSTTLACTASSDGFIHVYDVASVSPSHGAEAPQEIEPLARYDSKGTRLTCITVADGDIPGGKGKNAAEKRKREDGEDIGEDDESEDEDDDGDEIPIEDEHEGEDEEEDEDEEEEEEEEEEVEVEMEGEEESD